MPSKLALAVLTTLVALASSRPASACSCVRLEGSGSDRADLIFEGTVTAVGVHEGFAVTRFSVHQFWKGYVGDVVDVTHPFGGNGSCAVEFAIAETYLLGAGRDPDSCGGTTDLCSALNMSVTAGALGPGAEPGSGAGPLDIGGATECALDGGGAAYDEFLRTFPWDGGTPSPVPPNLRRFGATDASTPPSLEPPAPSSGNSAMIMTAALEEPEREEAGCSCRVGRRRGEGTAWLGLVVLAGVFGLRWRRRHPRTDG